MERNLSFFARLAELKNISHHDKGLNLTHIEQAFLAFSAVSLKPKLDVHIPLLYTIKGDEKNHFADALSLSGVPPSLDISGRFEGSERLDQLLFLSTQQMHAELVDQRLAYLIPLLEVIYKNGQRLLSDFTLHEAVLGTVDAYRGDIPLKDTHLNPRDFKQGPYHLKVVLDTPHNTISSMIVLREQLNTLKSNPKSSLLNPEFMAAVKNNALSIRERIGSLSRYAFPNNNVFKVQTNGCIIETNGSTVFYTYNPKKNINIAVYFGKNPFMENPFNLIILNGDQYHHTLQALVEHEIYMPSEELLSRRIRDFNRIYSSAFKQSRTLLRTDYPDFTGLEQQLKTMQQYFQKTPNSDMHKNYLLNQSPELLEFVVLPLSNDIVMHQLLPRLSWNSHIRGYQDTRHFKEAFEVADDQGREEFIKKVLASIHFSNQQNLDVNLWLYQHHQDLCIQAGAEFKVIP